MKPAREFKGHALARHAPDRPYLHSLGDYIDTESRTEGTAALRLDRRDDVARILPQPFWIERRVNGRRSWACVDFLVETVDGSLVAIEVKGAIDGLAEETVAGLKATAVSCGEVGLAFEFMVALPGRQQDIFDLLASYQGSRVPVGPGWRDLKRAVEEVAQTPTTLRDLWVLGPSWQIKPLVWWMLWWNRICFDWEPGSLSESTLLRLHDGAGECAAHGGAPLPRTICGPAHGPMLSEIKARR